MRSRFDFAFIPAGPWKETIDFVRLGEELRYRCAWLPDQTFHRDPFVLLALCAQATREIDLGLGITSPFTRLPVQIARAAAVIDEVAGGRFRLGLGTANAATVLAPLGIELRKPASRVRDAIVIIRRLLRGESVDFEGGADTLRGVKLDFPLLRPNTPIYIGTRGPRMLELVGELADGVLAESLFSGDGMAYVMDHVREGARRGSRALSDIDVVSWQVVQVTDDEQAAIAAQKPWGARSISVGPPDAMRRVGIDEEVIVGVMEAMKRGDVRNAINCVTDEAIKCLMIIGSPDHVYDQLVRVFSRGATSVSLLLMGSMASMRDTLVRFAGEVMPRFR